MRVRCRRTRRVVVAALLIGACSSAGPDDREQLSPGQLQAEVAAACERTRDLHNEITTIANDLALAEVDASPADRAVILADGFDHMIDAAENGTLAEEPASLTAGLAERRASVVADMRDEAASFRATWNTIPDDQRRSAVTQIFTWGEKLMSETEPRVTTGSDPDLIAAIAAEPACRHVIQLP